MKYYGEKVSSMKEEFVREIANKISDGIIILNADDRVIYANNYIKKALNVGNNEVQKIIVDLKSKEKDKIIYLINL